MGRCRQTSCHETISLVKDRSDKISGSVSGGDAGPILIRRARGVAIQPSPVPAAWDWRRASQYEPHSAGEWQPGAVGRELDPVQLDQPCIAASDIGDDGADIQASAGRLDACRDAPLTAPGANATVYWRLMATTATSAMTAPCF